MVEDEKIVLSRKAYITPSECNAQHELGVPMLTQRLIDVATEHANLVGAGNPDMPDPDMGWVLSRLTIEMHRWPEVNTEYTVSTWVEDWNRHFSKRAFSIRDQAGNTIGYARSIWMVLNMKDRTNAGLSQLNFKKEWLGKMPCPIPMQEKHQKIEAADSDVTYYRFKYCDIDFYRHVNTVRYVDLLLNQFSMDEYDRNFVGRLELSFLHEANYGHAVEIHNERSDENPQVFRISLADAEKEILYARVRFEKRL